ncbi:aldehyde dehydrogenase (NADP(+)) [Salegentibacter sp. F188]|uniref:Aldehyde dehydrogenase (NADP(+)) n=1 Tax=Autumnicola patrickiae TaxID=3075591 RepID=A0ABU3DZE1_9FLAO|nr:aldehyde dehydrogenase (NADP(+)) [Salegentibacter sp. F188]MDT0689081.1 aldehyde dehydrogenase (NADP(+)) [Salegentibacter sp. F188]
MSNQKILIAGGWRDARNPEGFFHSSNPAEKSELSDSFPISSREEVLEMIQSGKEAAEAMYSIPPEKIADFLEKFASNIEACTDELVEIAHLETALPKETRLRAVELPRTTDQLRQAAVAVRERSWAKATIDTKSNIRAKFGALGGPVVVFGPNNFPYAFNSVSGGDFASAIAAGNPVIAKANPAQVGTTKVLAEAAFEAVKASGLPKAAVQLIYHIKTEVGLMLVSHPDVGATGFTGGRPSGLKLKEAADKAGKPIYLEMSSVNPVFFLSEALNERHKEIATELYASCSLGSGQFCTNPGLVVVENNEAGMDFLNSVTKSFAENEPGTLFSSNGPKNIADAVATLVNAGAEVLLGGKENDGPGYSFQNTLLKVSGDTFLQNSKHLQTEAFGTVTLFVFVNNSDQMKAVAAKLEGNLTGSIYSDRGGEDDQVYKQIEPVLRTKVGRLLNDKMPTSVAVVASMNHGGPYPATGHPGFSAVGIPGSMIRFAALHSYDNVREHRLPVELKNENPTGKMWRLIDGQWSQGNVVVN